MSNKPEYIGFDGGVYSGTFRAIIPGVQVWSLPAHKAPDGDVYPLWHPDWHPTWRLIVLNYTRMRLREDPTIEVMVYQSWREGAPPMKNAYYEVAK